MGISIIRKVILFSLLPISTIYNASAAETSTADKEYKTQCSLPLKVKAESAPEYGLVVTYIDSRMRITMNSYSGFAAKNLTPGSYEIILQFDEPCESLMGKLINSHVYN